MKSIEINSALWVADQVALDDFAALAEAGFTDVINNRPDDEEPNQPGTEAEARAAAAAGLGYAHIPVTRTTITEADIRRFQAAIARASGRVLAHCKSGTRTLMLWAIGEVLDQRMRIEDIETLGRTVGIDLADAARWCASHDGCRR